VSHYHISPHNYKQYSAAFYAQDCLECGELIEEGDPIGWLTDGNSEHGPLCKGCLDELKENMEVRKE
jgi:hypothetical protein